MIITIKKYLLWEMGMAEMREKILKYAGVENIWQIVENISFFTLGFIMSFSKIAGIFSPFCLAFSMALPKKWSIYSFLGGICGVGLFDNLNGMTYIFALSLGLIFRMFFGMKFVFASAMFSVLSMSIPHIISMLVNPVGFGTIIMIYTEIILTGSVTALLKGGLTNFSINPKKTSDLAGFSMVAIAFLVAFCNLSFFGLNFGRLLSAILVAESAILAGAGGGAVVGIVATIGLALFTKDFALVGAILTVSGFISGIFNMAGRFFQSMVFVLTYLLGCGFFGGVSVNTLVEVSIASCFVCIFPVKNFLGLFAKNRFSRINDRLVANDEVALKLQFTAKTLLDLQSNIQKCAKKMDSLTYKDISDIYVKAADEVCKKCSSNTFCWIKSYNEIMRALNHISKLLRQNGNLSMENVPIFLKQKCCKIEKLVGAINLGYREFLCMEQTARRVNEARSIATEQFSGMSELLMEMSEEIADFEKVDHETTQIVASILKDYGINFSGISCFLDRFDHLIIDLYLDELPEKTQLCEMAEIISQSIDRQLEVPSITRANKSYKISFFEVASLRIDFSAVQTSPSGNTYCGDSYDFFMDGKGFAHMLLSDGMGNGDRAAVDSVMTCSTMKRLLQTGFGFKSTLKLLNLSFAIKSKEESLATIDTCTIDLYTGMVKFVKAGATYSYVSSKGSIKEIPCSSLPIGIIQGIAFDSKELKLSKGDVIVMVTDGVTAAGTDWVSCELKAHIKQSSKEIANKIMEGAKKRSDCGHADDITVLVSKII